MLEIELAYSKKVNNFNSENQLYDVIYFWF